MLRILSEQCGLPDGGAIHSYSGSPDLIPQFIALNASLSFSGSITFDRNKRGRASAAAVPENNLLIETDAPDIAPLGIEAGKNEPAHLPAIAATIAALRGRPVDRIGEITTGNAMRLFAR